jgi:hypothetical protein
MQGGKGGKQEEKNQRNRMKGKEERTKYEGETQKKEIKIPTKGKGDRRKMWRSKYRKSIRNAQKIRDRENLKRMEQILLG